MMKNTQKKLNSKHFRYLSKENIKNPKEFLGYFFKRIDLERWQEKIYVFLSSGSVQQRYPMHDPTFVHQSLVEHLEYAYVLYHKYELTIEANRFFEYLFERQSLANWLVQLDDVLRNQTDNCYYLDDDNYNPYLINLIELTHYLALYLYLYVNNQEAYFQFPYYILPIHKLQAEELTAKNYHERIGSKKTKTHKIKRFRYLAPAYVTDPNRFLKEVVYQWGIDWSVNFGFLFSYSMCPQLDKNRVFEYGFSYLHLAQMIEVAYTILKMRDWKPTARKKTNIHQNFCDSPASVERKKTDAKQVICDFFGFMNLRDWYDLLDELLLSSDIRNTRDIIIRPEHLMARELIVQLPDALLKLHQEATELNNS